MVEFFPSRTVAIELFGFGIHWYGLLYFLSFVLAWALLPRLQRYRNVDLGSHEWSSILTAAVIGVIIGGRLGYVLFYDPSYYLAHPIEILFVWQGGMSSHGGFIGVTLALWYVLRHKSVENMLRIADVIIIPVAIGLALGRVGNFINQELYGTVTTLPWGIRVPGQEGLRHPTQLYAVIKDLFIAAVCFAHLRYKAAQPGQTMAIFLVLYGVLRFLNEFLRVQTHESFAVGSMVLTRGQLYTIPLIIIGLVLFLAMSRRRSA